jgi:solute carrier family 13 (sodium-dependent dicarboxylate transporter), member 2/3/5
MTDQFTTHGSERAANLALFYGPVLSILVFMLLPAEYVGIDGLTTELTHPARVAAAIAVLMAIWWMTEAVSVYVTALLPLALFPVFGVAKIQTVSAAYGNEIIFLFMGGFIVALALERWGLHRRFALNLLAAVGPRPGAIVAAFMGAAALISMWVTNTATTMMLLPVPTSVIAYLPHATEDSKPSSNPFAICLLLAIAYGSSIGGMGTIVGTAPNAFVVSFVREQLGREIGFFEWMSFAFPLVITFLPLAWLLLVRVLFPLQQVNLVEAVHFLRSERATLGTFSRGEKLTLLVFAVTALAWIFRPLLNLIELNGYRPLEGLTDSGIAILAAVSLFLLPVNLRQRVFLVDWPTAVRLPWGVLILFGGGLALAAALVDTGFSDYLATRTTGLEHWPSWLIVLLVVTLVVFLTELTSNTAITATMVPLLLSVALGLGIPPLLLIIPAAFSASCAFMLPVATPPNAIVFGTGLITIGQMSRAGFWLNIVSVCLITLASYAIILPALGIRL